MKLHTETTEAPLITGYGPGWLAVGQTRHAHSLLVDSGGAVQAWDCARFEALSAAHFVQIAAWAAQAQVLLFGSGAHQHFVPPAWLGPLVQLGLSMETMDTRAACRTYNILALEGRRVQAALLL